MPREYVTVESLQSMWVNISGDSAYWEIDHEFFRLSVREDVRIFRWSFHTMQTELRGTELSFLTAQLVCAKFAVDYINRGLVGLV